MTASRSRNYRSRLGRALDAEGQNATGRTVHRLPSTVSTLDQLKKINEPATGRLIGSEALCRCLFARRPMFSRVDCRANRHTIREIGGDEFVVILPRHPGGTNWLHP